jgi:hypothetical protein
MTGAGKRGVFQGKRPLRTASLLLFFTGKFELDGFSTTPTGAN